MEHCNESKPRCLLGKGQSKQPGLRRTRRPGCWPAGSGMMTMAGFPPRLARCRHEHEQLLQTTKDRSISDRQIVVGQKINLKNARKVVRPQVHSCHPLSTKRFPKFVGISHIPPTHRWPVEFLLSHMVSQETNQGLSSL